MANDALATGKIKIVVDRDALKADIRDALEDAKREAAKQGPAVVGPTRMPRPKPPPRPQMPRPKMTPPAAPPTPKAPLTNFAGRAMGRMRSAMPAMPKLGGIGKSLVRAIPLGPLKGIGSAIKAVGSIGVKVGSQLALAGTTIAKNFLGGAFRMSISAGRKVLSGFGSVVRGLGRGIKGLISTTVALAAPLMAIGALLGGGLAAGAAVKTFADFESAMARVKALTGATNQEFRLLEARAEELGAKTMFSASQAADAMGNFAQAGFKVHEIMGAVGPTLDLAAAGQLDMATASDITAKVMRGMGIEASELTGVVDVLAKAFSTSNTDLQMLGEAMKYVGPVAKASGKDLNEVVASLQVLSDAGLQASMAGTSLRGIISRLAQNGPEVKKVFEGLGVDTKDAAGNLRPISAIVEDFNAAIKAQGRQAQITSLSMGAFGERAGPAFAVLLAKGGDALREYEQRLADAGGTAQKIAEIQRSTLKGAFDELFSVIEGAAISFGRTLAPAVNMVTKALTNVTPVIGGILTKIRPLSDAIGTAISGRIEALGQILSRNGGEFQKWFRSMSEIFNNVVNLVGKAAEAVGNFGGKLLGIQGGMGGIGDAAIAQISKILDAISTFTFNPIEMGKAAFEGIGAMLLDTLSVGIASFTAGLDMTFKSGITGFGAVLSAFIQEVPEALKAGFFPNARKGRGAGFTGAKTNEGGHRGGGLGSAIDNAAGEAAGGFDLSTFGESMAKAAEAMRESQRRRTEAVERESRVARFKTRTNELEERFKAGDIPREVYNEAFAELRATLQTRGDLRGDRTQTESNFFRSREQLEDLQQNGMGRLTSFGSGIAAALARAGGVANTGANLATDRLGVGSVKAVVDNTVKDMGRFLFGGGPGKQLAVAGTTKITGGEMTDVMSMVGNLQQQILTPQKDALEKAAETTAENTSEKGALHKALTTLTEQVKKINTGVRR